MTCKSRKKNIEFPYKIVSEIKTEYTRYHIKEVAINGDSISIKVQYGGGCVKPHIFEIVELKNDNDSRIQLHLLHLTTNDRCKALLRETLTFDLKPYFNLNSKSVFFNGQEIYPNFEFTTKEE
jgi:hypothetical protein